MSTTISEFVRVSQGASEYARLNFPVFLDFLTFYFESQEQVGQVIQRIMILLEQRNVDFTLDDFFYFFRREFLQNIPQNILTDKRKLVKHIKQFYRARGSEKSFKFFFRILFDDDVEFYYPKVDILRLSDGKWSVDTVIRTTTVHDTYQFVSREIKGLTSGAVANVENVVKFPYQNLIVSEIYLTKLDGEFSIGETVEVIIPGNITVHETAYGLLTDPVVTNPGTGYKDGDLLLPNAPNISALFAVDVTKGFEVGRVQSAVLGIYPQPSAIKLSPRSSTVNNFYRNMFVEIIEGPGTGQSKSIVSYNGTNHVAVINGSWGELPTQASRYKISTGGISTIKVKDFGVNYTSGDGPFTLDCTLAGNGDALAIPLLSAVGRYAGRFANSDGFLSWDKRFQDSFYWQDFSYDLKSTHGIEEYRNPVKRLLHPASLALFGTVRIGGINLTRRSHSVDTQVTSSSFTTTLTDLNCIAKYSMLEDLTDDQKLFDVRDVYPDGNNAILGGNLDPDVDDPLWSTEGLNFDNSYATSLGLPVDKATQTILVVAKPDNLDAFQSIVGSIDMYDSTVTGYKISVDTDGSVIFRAQKSTTTETHTLTTNFPSGTIVAGNYYFFALRYSNNTLVGNIGQYDQQINVFPDDVDSLDILDNSRGYSIGTGGVVDRLLFPPIPGMGMPGMTLGGEPMDTPELGDQRDFFEGTVSYVIIYDAYLSDEDIQNAFLSLKFEVVSRGIAL